MIRYLQHLLLQWSISSAQSFCCSCGAYANKQDMASKHIHQRFKRDLTGQLVTWSTSHLPVAPWLVLFWLMPSRIVGNGNETFFAHLSTWLKSTPLFPQRFTSQKLVASYFGIHSRTYKNHQNNLNEGYPRCQVLPKSDPIKLPWLPFSYFYLPTILSQPTNQSSLR